MSDSNWPEPTPEPGEPPRVLTWLAYAAIAAGALFLISIGANWRLPQFDMPRIAMPDIDLRDNSGSISQQAPATNEAAEILADALLPDVDGDSVQTVPFEDCIQTMESGLPFGVPTTIEDTADRRVVRYKFLDGNLTVTCTRADSTLRIEQG
jgi:hypothetical protein